MGLPKRLPYLYKQTCYGDFCEQCIQGKLYGFDYETNYDFMFKTLTIDSGKDSNAIKLFVSSQ